jgi:hypothetical protein
LDTRLLWLAHQRKPATDGLSQTSSACSRWSVWRGPHGRATEAPPRLSHRTQKAEGGISVFGCMCKSARGAPVNLACSSAGGGWVLQKAAPITGRQLAGAFLHLRLASCDMAGQCPCLIQPPHYQDRARCVNSETKRLTAIVPSFACVSVTCSSPWEGGSSATANRCSCFAWAWKWVSPC